MNEFEILQLIEWLRNDKLGNDLLNCRLQVLETKRAATPKDILDIFKVKNKIKQKV